MVSSAGSAQERLTEVVAAAVEVAAEAGETGSYTAEVGRTLTALVEKVGARIAVESEIRGFSSGWQEAVEASYGPDLGGGARARVLRIRPEGDAGR
ncbi:hypothetical protein ACIPPS_05315 [Streptomyces sp. NPDC090127]|uniref:hypothetical protein n=1 Tax=Streptomyces sp. NPDC090127 TaxID=3365953 RepID=UPI0038233603